MTVTVRHRGGPLYRSAHFSDDRLHRYGLLRRWDDPTNTAPLHPDQVLTFCMLNPSTADETVDDRTINRCIGYARDMGRDALIVLNVYAFRATYPRDLWLAEDPVGPDNDAILANHFENAAETGNPIVAAWGALAKPERVAQVLALPGAESLTALGVTKGGAPRHPLYMPRTARPVRWPA